MKDAILNGETEASSLSKRIILPTTFIGGLRYMIQNYQDAMAICSSIGYLDLFITLYILLSSKSVDYHLHIYYYFLHKSINSLVLRGPYGIANKNSPYMENGVCTRHFPKIFVKFTTINKNGYPLYRRRNDCHTIKVSGIHLIIDLVLSDDELSKLTLIEIEQILNSNGKTLREYATMQFLNMDNFHSMRCGSLQNKLILDELCTGNTFVWNTISAALRSKGQTVLTVTSSGKNSFILATWRKNSLFQNIRLRSSIEDEIVREQKEFAQWILDLGDGKLAHSEDGYSVVPISPELLITNFDDPIHAIVEAIYSDYLKDPREFSNLHGRAILAPTINVVKQSIFTYGQLYVAVSRVTKKYELKIVISHDNSNNYTKTNNIIYHEVFRNI
ncbi:uncharacterized protein LOC130934471 [Arachis stenosperma]|uniref:uncharacterized protein LOC130934471 n=1 Tax=Arachis stenosperma TaxID=217475 RepID=UPI0025ACF1EF|nr:uncharacterized protein LOC130934471 [Arachis stenosperma]